MTKNIFTTDKGWTRQEDSSLGEDSETLRIEDRAPARIFEEEAEEVEFDINLLPFEKVLNNHIMVLVDKYKRPRGRKIVLTDKEQRMSTRGKVVALSNEITDIAIGDLILYSQFAGYALVFESLPLIRCIGREEVLSILKKNAPELISESS